MSGRGGHGPGIGAGIFGIFIVLAVLWALRWIILGAVVLAIAFGALRWLVLRYLAHLAAERARLDGLRRRATIQDSQVLRGDPAGFFGEFPLPDPELIPAWYRQQP